MFKVDREKCIGCGQCIKDCFVKDIVMTEGRAEIKNKTCIKCGHCIAVCPVDCVSTDEYNMEEVIPYNKESFQIAPETLLNFIKFERTIREFKKQDVEIDKLLKIIEAGRFTQTASNAQNVNYVVVRENIQELRKITLEILDSFGNDLLNSDTIPLYKRYALMWKKMYKDFLENPQGIDNLFFHAPALVLVTSDHPLNAGLAATDMKLMTNALGLGTVFSGFFTRASEVSPKIKEFVGIAPEQQIVVCMVIGYPNVHYKRTVPRKAPSIIWK